MTSTDLTDEQHQNKRLADRLAAGNAGPDLDELIAGVRERADAYLDVPGPRAAQLCDEIDRLRGLLTTIRDTAAKANPNA